MKTQKELEEERIDREQRAEEMMDLQQKLAAEKLISEQNNEEVINALNNPSINTDTNSILLSKKLRSNANSPKVIDVKSFKNRLEKINVAKSTPKSQLTSPRSEINTPVPWDVCEKLKKYERIIDDLEDKLLDMVEKYNNECVSHQETHESLTAEIKHLRKKLAKLVKVFKTSQLEGNHKEP